MRASNATTLTLDDFQIKGPPTNIGVVKVYPSQWSQIPADAEIIEIFNTVDEKGIPCVIVTMLHVRDSLN